MSQPQAYLQCRCGACRITLCDPTMRARSECLCFDCRQRALIAASKHPANALPPAVASYKRGVDLVYFANALIVDAASQQLLEFSKLTEQGFNTTATASCCGTLMCGVHPLYEGTTISVNADNCRVTSPSSIPSQLVVFASDAPAQQAAEIARRRTVPVLFAVYEELDHPAMVALVTAVTEPVSPQAKALATTSFEALCAANGVTISNACFEESRAQVPGTSLG